MKPKLRDIKLQPSMVRGQQGFVLSDPLEISQKTLFMPIYMSFLLSLLDGTRDIGTIKTGFELRIGRIIALSDLELLISRLDEALFLENENFFQRYQKAIDNYRSSKVRSSSLAGSSYPKDPNSLRENIQRYLDKVSDASHQEIDKVVALISPHIDYQRGATIYSKVWSKARKSLEQTELIVILGTDHVDGKGSITLTRQNYETPLGVIATDGDVVNELAGELGDDAFANELNHRGEHSIELALVWLQFILGDKTCPVVPILCGSFFKFIENGESPLKAKQVITTINFIKRLYLTKRILIIAAADLAHMGPVFGDSIPMDIGERAKMASDDEKLMEILCRGDVELFYSLIQKEKDRRHICGVPPIYITLASMPEAEGTSVGYAICPASPDYTSLVSICGILYKSGKE
ncbi:MAG: AmmeMemoRadiSam system protein B [Dehalococcoidia bacterium]|nr:MAG: AmmeMemoRadiSam system protein B [Dehalococcoidia bacterium]